MFCIFLKNYSPNDLRKTSICEFHKFIASSSSSSSVKSVISKECSFVSSLKWIFNSKYVLGSSSVQWKRMNDSDRVLIISAVRTSVFPHVKV